MTILRFLSNFDLASRLFAILVTLILGAFAPLDQLSADDELSSDEQQLIAAVEQYRIKAIQRVVGSVIAIYDLDRQGGGSGVIIDPSGIALTNHHVIMGAGVEGWGGLADGKLYRWKLIGTDPGGDVALIQMEGKSEFPFTPLGNSDLVKVGDWALVMGNPFILTEDQSPTVTLGIVSGVKRYQPGAGLNQLVYGNCIQVDSSINPGNSGGPLFNLSGEVIGINGRGSFKERGRVNVGLGYAISSNQIKNFIPELLATKLVEHATLDASFSDRNGKVVCSKLSVESPVAESGLEIGDQLLEFEGNEIRNSNQFTNLICTLPEDWPAELLIRKKDGSKHRIIVRTFGLPYKKPKTPPAPKKDPEKKQPEREKKQKRLLEMIKLLSAPPGEMRFKEVNRRYAQHVIADWNKNVGQVGKQLSSGTVKLVDRITRDEKDVGSQSMWLSTDGRIRIELDLDGQTELFVFDGASFYRVKDGTTTKLSLVEAKLNLTLVQAISMSAAFSKRPFQIFGDPLIDGSDKALGQNSFRLKMLDSDLDRFFCWLRMYGEDGRPAARLIKASANKDCDDPGGVTFSQWQEVGPVIYAGRRELVSGLNESTFQVLTSESSQWLDVVDDSWFKIETAGGKTEEKSGSTGVRGEQDAPTDDSKSDDGDHS